MINGTLLLAQLLTGRQYGVLLFLLAAGLTLVFGIMNFVNLAHGSLYMIGAYLAAQAFEWTHSFALAAVIIPTLVVVIALTRLSSCSSPDGRRRRTARRRTRRTPEGRGTRRATAGPD